MTRRAYKDASSIVVTKQKSLNDGNTELLEWASDPYTTKKGTLEFEKRDGTNMKTLEFEEGYISMMVNNNEHAVAVPMRIQTTKKPEFIFGKTSYDDEKITIGSGDTLIIKWI